MRETVSESTSNFINNALYQTVSGDGGTAGAAAVAGYEVAGKTGTAQKQPRAEKNYLVSFIGFAPVDNPQLLVYVVVDEPNAEEEFHSTLHRKSQREFSKRHCLILIFIRMRTLL